jgi:predicted NACHT family NTPase
LILVDGLYEITGEQDRILFVRQLRTFLSVYPSVGLVVTSREAGFRVSGGALSAQCDHFKLCDFDSDDITRLTFNWNKEVFGDTSRVRTESKVLAESICANDRLMRLAANPLLLTTLLLVKRWVGGPLPTKRSILYGKAIEVLLMTWNVEGHEPLDLEEVLPQLEFLAFVMMKDGEQSISSRKLRDVITKARHDMPEVLGWSKISVHEFVERVELRSSLLMLSGHVVQEGAIHPTYEFRHLTFQEYLVARAIVNGHYPGRNESDDLLSVLEPNLWNQSWSEVISLTAVLAGRKAQSLVKKLIEGCRQAPASSPEVDDQSEPVELLSACLLDEVQVTPDVLMESMVCALNSSRMEGRLVEIGRGKYKKHQFPFATVQ